MKALRMCSYIILFILFISSFLVSCKKSKSTTTAQADGPVITGIGTTTGAASDSMIGPSGGTIHSTDGKLTITIPANAISSVTNISIQPITNQAPLGLGSGYRLQPEGMIFAKPLLLKFQYNDQMLQQFPEDFLWIVTQAGDGSWNAMLKSALDRNTKTVTITTTHFGDWALGKFIDLTLTPAAAIIKKNQSLALRMAGFVRPPGLPDDAELTPLIFLTGADVDLTPLTPNPPVESRLMNFKVKQWTMNGAPAPVSNSNGSLTTSGNSGTFTAPGQIPAISPAAVSVQLEAFNKAGISANFLVTSNITVVEDNFYLLLKIDGQPYKYTQYGYDTAAPPDPNNFSQVISGMTGNKLEIMASVISGTAPPKNLFVLDFTNPSETTKVLVGSNNNGNDNLSFMLVLGTSYELNYQQRTLNQGNCERVNLCGNATATLTTYSVTDMLVTGTFSGTIYEDNSGFFNSCTTPIPHTITGEFRVMRSN